MANSRSKGSKNERNLCKWWQDWTGMEFTRIPASGGLRWGKTDNISGDLICADPRHSRRFPFTIEAKFYKEINFEHLISGVSKVKILEFWAQANEDAERAKKIPFLFMRYNGMKSMTWFTVIEYRFLKILKSEGFKPENPFFKVILPEGRDIIIFNSSDLLNVNYRNFSVKIKKHLRNAKKR